MQEILATTSGKVGKPDFEPIIIEEVYYNAEEPQSQKKSRNSVSITPSIMLKNALKISLNEQKKMFLPTDKVDIESNQVMANSHREIDRLFDSKQKGLLHHTDGSNQLLGVTNGRVDKTYDKTEH